MTIDVERLAEALRATDAERLLMSSAVEEARAIAAEYGTPASQETALREALTQAIECGYIDLDLYHNDPVYHAVAWEIRAARAALAAKEADHE